MRQAGQERRWSRARAEHDAVVGDFIAAVGRIAPHAWHEYPAPGKWTPAALALHVAQAYEFGVEAARGGAGMRMRAPAPVAWASRVFLLPLLLASKRFPQGAPAPAEVRPDLARAKTISQPEATVLLERIAREAADALHNAARSDPGIRVTHAYFGPLDALTGMRLLSAHTRHHAGHMHALATAGQRQ